VKRALPYTLVTIQFVLLGALVLVPRGTLWPLDTIAIVVAAVFIVLGGALAVLGVVGLGSSLTASPVPKSGSSLVTTGIYSAVRHPIYTGLLVGGIGLVILGASPWHIGLWVALLVLLALKSRWEERMLLAKHPDYRDYGARSGRFLPGIGRLR
jgi:protein-S-isoprenylcysteine O-methyltransferase Ste14